MTHCTSDISPTEKLSLIIRYVHSSNENVEICKSSLGFVPALDLIGKGLAETVLEE